jgi:uncharacterized protein (DUF1697 family)
MKYVALLRGINVGGNNRISMKDLVVALDQAGFKNVSTYINSGNVFFTDVSSTIPTLQKSIEKVIAETFGLDVKTLVLSKPTIDTITKTIPKEWTNGTEMKCDVMFLWDTYKAKTVITELPVRAEIDTVIAVENAIVWSVERKNVTKSGLVKIIGTDLYKHMTIRNCNTTRKIQQRLEEQDEPS